MIKLNDELVCCREVLKKEIESLLTVMIYGNRRFVF